jgi:hypothetical protein
VEKILINDLLKQVEAEQRKFGYAPQSGATQQQLVDLGHSVQLEFGENVPPGYLEFLRIVNGFEWDGAVIYPSQTTKYAGHPDRIFYGFVDQNIAFREPLDMRDYLLLGEDNMDIYVYQISTGKFEVRDRVPFDNLSRTYSAFDELVVHALKRSLNID